MNKEKSINSRFNYQKLINKKVFQLFSFLALFILFLTIFNSNLVFAQPNLPSSDSSSSSNQHLYADIKIFVEKDGSVSIDGISNYKQILNISNSQNFTSKKGEFWIFNLTTNEVFEDYIFELNLPHGVEVNYIKTTPSFRIDSSNEDYFRIIGIGENRELNIIVQYKQNKTKDNFLTQNIILSFLSGFFIFFLIFITIILIKKFYGDKNYKNLNQDKNVNKGKNKNQIESSNIQKEETKNFDETKTKTDKEIFLENINLEILPQRQQEIIQILSTEERLTQKDLEEKMQIPKSSVSRNVNSLVSRNILKKEKSGISTYISLNFFSEK